MDKVYVLSHTDLDGYLSAGLVEFYYRRFIDKDAEFKHKSWTYGRNLPNLDFIKKNYDSVFIVDLCPDPAQFMVSLYEYYKDKFIWIDHHTKPDSDFLEYFKLTHNEQILGLIAEEEHHSSAAYLVYKYFESKYNTDNPGFLNHVPTWLKHCSDFDCWNRTDDYFWQHDIMPMFSYLKGKCSTPELAYNYIQERYDSGNYYDALHRVESGAAEFYNCQTTSELEEGRILYKAIRAIYKAEAKHGFERILQVEMAGVPRTIKAWICNTQNRSSVIFEQMENIDDYDVFIPYHFNGEKYFYSMYTYKKDIKCNEIVVFESGDWHIAKPILTFNGHEDAAGANSEKFAFPKY